MMGRRTGAVISLIVAAVFLRGAPAPAQQLPHMKTPAAVVAVEGLLVRFGESRDPALLAEARAHLATIRGQTPRYTYGAYLTAFTHRLAGEGDAAREAIAALRPENRSLYTYYLGTPPETQVLAALRCNYVNSCIGTELRSLVYLDPFRYVREAPVKIHCGGVIVDPKSCPPEWDILGRLSWPSLGEDRLTLMEPRGGALEIEDLLRLIGVKEGMTVADVGAGTGYFTFPIARAVGPKGRVYALEIDKIFTDILEFSAKDQGAANVVVKLAKPSDVDLPAESVDLVLLFEVAGSIVSDTAASPGGESGADRGGQNLTAFLKSCFRALKPEGRLVIADYTHAFTLFAEPRVEEPKIMESTIMKGARKAGFAFAGEVDVFLPQFGIRLFTRTSVAEEVPVPEASPR